MCGLESKTITKNIFKAVLYILPGLNKHWPHRTYLNWTRWSFRLNCSLACTFDRCIEETWNTSFKLVWIERKSLWQMIYCQSAILVCTLLNSNSNYLLKLANTDFNNHETVKFGCGFIEVCMRSVMSEQREQIKVYKS
jgi:hypothetical protein